MRIAIIVILASMASGCIMTGEPRRCYGIGFPLIKIGQCPMIPAEELACPIQKCK